MDSAERDLPMGRHPIDLLTANYECIFYLPYHSETDLTEYIGYRSDSVMSSVVTELFSCGEEKIKTGYFGDVLIYEEDCEKLWNETRKNVIERELQDDSVYYVFFRAFIRGRLHYFKLKYAADRKDGELTGIVVALINNGATERIRRRQELDLYQAIDNAERTIMEKNAELRERTLALSAANSEAIDLLGNVVELRNQESGLHIKRVKVFTRVLAEQIMEDWPEYRLTEELIDVIVSASSLHDVGKIMVPDRVLLKQGKLTPEEMQEMKKHCEYGLEILRSAPKSWTAQYTKIALDICTCHHEKWDGNGYPNGLKGDQIPISAQIVSVADCYDALSTKRVYKPAYTPDESYEMIAGGKCGAFSEKILSCFAKCREKFAQIIRNPNLFRERAPVQLSGENKLRGLSILLVDDSDISLDINSEILESEGAAVTTADNGTQAIERFTEGGPFDAIIMDIVMPELNGIEATKKIREIERGTGNRIPIIALSAEGKAHETLLEAGIDASMAKPLVVGELTRILISCMHNSSMQMQRQLMETLKIANTDALTKLKSIAAYTDMQAELNSEIKENKAPEFAVILCDINDLKSANDNYGHETGNIYIKNCAKVLCEIFPGSPIYRIGGDEFAVVLQGANYVNRDGLFRILHDRIDETEKIAEYMDGRASFAVGMSCFDPSADTEYHDVQSRADAAMYIDKRIRKEGSRR